MFVIVVFMPQTINQIQTVVSYSMKRLITTSQNGLGVFLLQLSGLNILDVIVKFIIKTFDFGCYFFNHAIKYN